MKRKRAPDPARGSPCAAGAAAWWLRSKSQARRALVLPASIEARDVEVGRSAGGRVAKVLRRRGRQRHGRPADRAVRDRPVRTSRSSRKRRASPQAQVESRRRPRGPRGRGDRQRPRRAPKTPSASALRFRSPPRPGHRRAAELRRRRDTGEDRRAEAFRSSQRGNRPEDIAVAASARSRPEEKQLGYLERQRAESRRQGSRRGRHRVDGPAPRATSSAANQPVARMLEPSQLWVRVYVPEPQLGRVHVGQRAADHGGHLSRNASFRKGRRDPHAVRVHAPQRPDARPAHGPGLRREGRDRPGAGAEARDGGDREAR